MKRPDWVDDELYPFADRWATIAGAEVHYVDEGEGRPLLMVHGNPTWSFLYRDIIRALRDEFRCVAVDLPGFGLSKPAPADYRFTPAEHAAVLAELIDHLGLDGYVVVGQDWGGPIGLAAAGRAPERVAGLVLGNTWAWSMARRPMAHVWSLSWSAIPNRYVVERLNAFVRIAMRFGASRRPTGRVMNHYERPFPTAASRKPTWVFAREVTGSSEFLDHEAGAALHALAGRPALLPWGDNDPVFSAGDRDRLAALLPQAEVHPLPGAGHFIQEDAPDEIAEAIRAWAARTL